MPTLPHVESELTFLGPVTGTPTNYLDVEPPPGVPKTYPNERHRVRIHDARGIASDLTLDRNGIRLARHPDGVLPDFRDDRAIQSRYYPALERLIREATGARRAVVFDHTFRSSALAKAVAKEASVPGWPAGNIDTPVNRAHNDYTPVSGPARVREMLERFAPDADAAALMRNRYAVYNVWRPTNGPVEQMPLAVCDMDTMRPDDFVPAELRWQRRTGHVSAVRYRPEQCWLYFPALDVDEAILFTGFDSRPVDGRWCSAHTAFADPTTRAGARPRESVEARVIALY